MGLACPADGDAGRVFKPNPVSTQCHDAAHVFQ